jgi:beta-aspartyl-peptidase (threonine type)
MRFAGATLETAAAETIAELKPGWGGLIAVDRHGRVAEPFNTTGMLRVVAGDQGEIEPKIWKDD